jgi:hypothetical protein
MEINLFQLLCNIAKASIALFTVQKLMLLCVLLKVATQLHMGGGLSPTQWYSRNMQCNMDLAFLILRSEKYTLHQASLNFETVI